VGRTHAAQAEAGRARLGRAHAVQAGRAVTVQLSRARIQPSDSDLFFYFLNIFKFLQIQKFVLNSFELTKL
jgi:hypothetical protein